MFGFELVILKQSSTYRQNFRQCLLDTPELWEIVYRTEMNTIMILRYLIVVYIEYRSYKKTM